MGGLWKHPHQRRQVKWKRNRWGRFCHRFRWGTSSDSGLRVAVCKMRIISSTEVAVKMYNGRKVHNERSTSKIGQQSGGAVLPSTSERPVVQTSDVGPLPAFPAKCRSTFTLSPASPPLADGPPWMDRRGRLAETRRHHRGESEELQGNDAGGCCRGCRAPRPAKSQGARATS